MLSFTEIKTNIAITKLIEKLPIKSKGIETPKINPKFAVEPEVSPLTVVDDPIIGDPPTNTPATA